MFNEQDLRLFEERGVSVSQINKQLDSFKNGFPYLRLIAAATVGNGIMRLTEAEENKYIGLWTDFLANDNKKIAKFVPASGAASRMFKNLFAFLDAADDAPTTDFMRVFFNGIHNFAFFADLNKVYSKEFGKTIDEAIKNDEYKSIVMCLLQTPGLNYGSLPKALIEFHKTVDGGVHTALEEHLEEGAQYAKNSCGEVNLHFTVSKEHRPLFEALVSKDLPAYSERFGVTYNVSFSEQKPSTDTIAVNPDNTPFRENGHLLFRPGGHGALIENLNEIHSDVVFIKNIDNVVPSTKRESTIHYKMVLGGVLVSLQQQIAHYIKILKSGKYDMSQLLDIVKFMHRTLFIRNEDTKHLEDSELAIYLLKKLERPIRVCGVVKNEGEPGGGPYIAYNADGTTSLQILESSQINKADIRAMELMSEATHFNPVDLVCYLTDVDGTPYDLRNFVDHSTGFISEKSKSGHPLKALELPGLWNGAMSDWNTVFVEVPVETFNPVKTVNDLLRPAHQL